MAVLGPVFASASVASEMSGCIAAMQRGQVAVRGTVEDRCPVDLEAVRRKVPDVPLRCPTGGGRYVVSPEVAGRRLDDVASDAKVIKEVGEGCAHGFGNGWIQLERRVGFSPCGSAGAR